jgi:hypothetical protein
MAPMRQSPNSLGAFRGEHDDLERLAVVPQVDEEGAPACRRAGDGEAALDAAERGARLRFGLHGVNVNLTRRPRVGSSDFRGFLRSGRWARTHDPQLGKRKHRRMVKPNPRG